MRAPAKGVRGQNDSPSELINSKLFDQFGHAADAAFQSVRRDLVRNAKDVARPGRHNPEDRPDVTLEFGGASRTAASR